MTNAIRIHQTGKPEVLRFEETTLNQPKAGEVLISHTAIGVDFIDTYHRSGLYPVAEKPFIPGMEAAGVIEAIGEGVSEFSLGERVAYGAGPIGAYAEKRVIPADKLVKLPTEISDETAASIMLKGLTARYLIKETYPVKTDDWVLVHAAAGGVGSLLCSWASKLGAKVIGTAGGEKKCAQAQKNGCLAVIDYLREDFVARVKELTNGKGVQVVYDGVGAATFEPSLDCLAPRGYMVTFGNASGPVPEISPLKLTQKGSIFLTRPSLFNYVTNKEEHRSAAADLFAAIIKGYINPKTPQSYALKDAAQAHSDLENRKTMGAVILKP